MTREETIKELFWMSGRNSWFKEDNPQGKTQCGVVG